MSELPKCTHPGRWAMYGGLDGVTHYISLVEVIGIKYDGTSVTLRLSNGHFVTTTETLEKVLADLISVC